MDNSKVWNHFCKVRGATNTKCFHCDASISCKGGSTGGLWIHLRTKHPDKLVNEKDPVSVHPSASLSQDALSKSIADTASKTTLSQTKISSFLLESRTLKESVARLAAEDGLTIRQITKSQVMRELFVAKNYNLPKSENSTMRLILDYYEEKKVEIINKIKSSPSKFSITLDEWSSLANRKYLNINIHNNDDNYINLGLVRVEGACSAEKTYEKVKDRLLVFGIIFSSGIVGSTSDGAAVMQKFGRISPAIMQLCYNHALHLAVTKTLYAKKESSDDFKISDVSSFIEEADDGNEIEHLYFIFKFQIFYDFSDNLSNSDYIDEDDSIETAECEDIFTDIFVTVAKIRKICKFFRYSSVKNSVLQKYILIEKGKQYYI